MPGNSQLDFSCQMETLNIQSTNEFSILFRIENVATLSSQWPTTWVSATQTIHCRNQLSNRWCSWGRNLVPLYMAMKLWLWQNPNSCSIFLWIHYFCRKFLSMSDILFLQKFVFKCVWCSRLKSLDWSNALTCSNEIFFLFDQFEQCGHFKDHGSKACCNKDTCRCRTNAFDVLVKAFGIMQNVQQMWCERVTEYKNAR